MSRHKGKKTQKDKKNKKTKTENVANRRRVYDVTQVTYEIIIGLERPSCEPRCTRATLVSFPYHVRHFCRAHTPIFYLHIYPLRASFTQTHHFATSRFLHFSFIYRISTIARATTSLPPRLLSFVCGENLRAVPIIAPLFFAYLSGDTARNDRAMTTRFSSSRARARIHCIGKKSRRTLACREKLSSSSSSLLSRSSSRKITSRARTRRASRASSRILLQPRCYTDLFPPDESWIKRLVVLRLAYTHIPFSVSPVSFHLILSSNCRQRH